MLGRFCPKKCVKKPFASCPYLYFKTSLGAHTTILKCAFLAQSLSQKSVSFSFTLR